MGTTFQVGDQVILRTKELLDAVEWASYGRVGRAPSLWLRSAPVAGPNTYTLTLPERFKCSPTIKVDRLKPYFLRTGLPPSPGPVTHLAGGGIRGGTAPQQQDGPRTDLLSSAVPSPRGRLVETGLAPR